MLVGNFYNQKKESKKMGGNRKPENKSEKNTEKKMEK